MRLRILASALVLAACFSMTGCTTYLATRALRDRSVERWSLPANEIQLVSVGAPASGMAVAIRVRALVEGEEDLVEHLQRNPGGPVVSSAVSREDPFARGERACVLLRSEDHDETGGKFAVAPLEKQPSKDIELRSGELAWLASADGTIGETKAPLSPDDARFSPVVVFQRKRTYDVDGTGWFVRVSFPPEGGRALGENRVATCERDVLRDVFLRDPVKERSFASHALHALLVTSVVPVTLAVDVATFPIQGLAAMAILLARA
ncbi:hypothetical protein HY251_05680 [bacterium]|nr:hypothetical protein [bacterium]